MRIAYWTVVAVASFSWTASAEPSSTTRYLMDEQVSMLDWGMYRVGELLDGTKVDVPGQAMIEMRSAVSYDWRSDRIQVALSTMFFAKPPPDRRAVCRNMIFVARELLGIDSSTGVPRKDSWTAGNAFQHMGFGATTEPKTLVDDVIAMIELEAKVYEYGAANRDGSRSPTRTTKCQGKLNSSEILFPG